VVLPRVSTEAMNAHLAEISTQVAPGAHAVVVLDGAGWHKPGGELRLPANLTLLPLPPYAPELNPVENVWEYLRGNRLSLTVWDTYDQIVEACCNAWNAFLQQPDVIASVAKRDWAAWVNE
jgi:transposase